MKSVHYFAETKNPVFLVLCFNNLSFSFGKRSEMVARFCRCRKLKSPFSGGTVLPSKPCLKRAPPSTQDIALQSSHTQSSSSPHRTEATLTKNSLQFQNYPQSAASQKAASKSTGRASAVSVSRSFSSPSPESSSSDSGFFK